MVFIPMNCDSCDDTPFGVLGVRAGIALVGLSVAAITGLPVVYGIVNEGSTAVVMAAISAASIAGTAKGMTL